MHHPQKMPRIALFIVFALMTSNVIAQKRMVPHVASAGGGFTTKVVISNPTANVQSFQFSGFNAAGQAIASAQASLDPFQTKTQPAQELFGMEISHFEVNQADQLTIAIIYQRDASGTGPVHVGESRTQDILWHVFPGVDGVTWDGLAAINTGTTTTDIQVTQVDHTGKTVAGPITIAEALVANGKMLYLFAQHFTTIPNTTYQISATTPLAIIALRGNLASDYLWENKAIPEKDFGGQPERIMPHVTRRSGGFKSQIIVANPFDDERNYEFTGFDEAGTVIGVAQGTLEPGQRLFRDADQMFDGEISHFTIANDTQLPVSMTYQKDRENAGLAQVHNLAQSGSSWRIYPGSRSVTWDGMALINRGSNPTDIIIHQVDVNGNLVRGPVQALTQVPAMGKGLYVFGNEFANEDNTFFEISSTQPITLMALRGNLASDFLWENGAVGLPEVEPGPLPPSRIDYAFAFDPGRRVSVMVGGFDKDFALLNDTWLWNGRRWRQVVTQASPLLRSHHGGTFNPDTQSMIIFGGFQSQVARRNDFKTFNGSDWLDFPGDPAIPAQDGELVYDTSRRVLILTVPNGNALQTWEYSNDQWRLIQPPTNPGKRLDQGLVYDEDRQRVVLFGGLNQTNTIVNETWEYDGTNWQRMAPTASPPALAGMAMFYDSVRNRTILFGGMDAARAITGETWSYDGTTWQKLTPPVAPSARWVAFASFDPERGVATIFGGEGQGQGGLTLHDDTWEFDGTTWLER